MPKLKTIATKVAETNRQSQSEIEVNDSTAKAVKTDDKVIISQPKSAKSTVKGGNDNSAKDDKRAFSIIEFLGIPLPKLGRYLNDIKFGKPIKNDALRTLFAYGFLSIDCFEKTDSYSLMITRQGIATQYFTTQLKGTTKQVRFMTEICPGVSGYNKPVRYYTTVYDMVDVCRNYPELVPLFTNAFKSVASYQLASTEEDKLSEYKDQKGGSITSHPMALQRMKEMRKVASSIIECESMNWDLFSDFARVIRLFCPGFSPKDWGTSVK